jgi:hypothetical protein
VSDEKAPLDRTKEPICGHCGVNRDALVLPGLLICHGCDSQVLKQATLAVPGVVERDHTCVDCAKPAE